MARNQSVERFRKLTEEMQQRIYDDAVAQLNAEADGLVNVMKAVVPVRTGALRDSIRKEPGKVPTRIRIVAGGASTTRAYTTRTFSYDYSRAVEFGTEKAPAEPFFFPSYRLKKRSMQSAMKRRITKRIKQYSAE